jgi:hypothetical protein
MTEFKLIEIFRGSNTQIAALYGQVISINFAMVVATYYFLNQSRIAIKALAFGMYLIGFIMFVGLMLEESNIKRVALANLAALPDASAMTRGLLSLQGGWLFKATAVMLNAGLWALALATTFLLFFWKKPGA